MKDIESLCRKSRMSCWVVPAIAAELWGVTIDRVLAGVVDGTVESRTENGFLFVDVAPEGQPLSTFSTRLPGQPAPPTYVVVERDAHDVFPTLYDQAAVTAPQPSLFTGLGAAASEVFDDVAWLHAMADQMLAGGVDTAAHGSDGPNEALSEDPEIPPLDEEEDPTPLPPRQAMRAAVARLRRPPPRPQVEA